jgi:hypothetical protein
MKSLLTVAAFVAGFFTAPTWSHAQWGPGPMTPAGGGGVVTRQAPPPGPSFDHVTPALELSYERFSAGNVNGGAMPLEALHLDMYPISWRWFRLGVDAEAGRGHADLDGATASVKYGLLGASAGFQVPMRIMPFVEGRFAGGVLGGTLDDPTTIPGTTVTVSNVSAATWMYTRGIDAGVNLYAVSRLHLTVALGWIRSTWGGANYDAIIAATGGNVQFKSVTHDSLLFKIGLGI